MCGISGIISIKPFVAKQLETMNDLETTMLF